MIARKRYAVLWAAMLAALRHNEPVAAAALHVELLPHCPATCPLCVKEAP